MHRSSLVRRVAAIAALGAAFATGTVVAQESRRQPYMEQALQALKDARGNLQKSTKDKGGHRERALKHVEEAIGEVNAGIKWDKERFTPKNKR